MKKNQDKKVFNNMFFVKQYDRMSRIVSMDMYLRFLQYLKNNCPKGRILDVGCGTGRGLLMIGQDSLYQVSGIDPASNMIKMCRKNAGKDNRKADFHVAGAEKLPFANEEFDAVISNGAFHEWQDAEKGLNEIYRVLKPGGIAFINDMRSDAEIKDIYDELGSRIFFKPMRKAFMKNIKKGTYTSSEAEAIVRKSLFRNLKIEEKKISYEIKLQK